MNSKIEQYLKRIRYTGGTEPTLENLAALQRAHLMSVPYEDLDIYYGRESSLAFDCVFNKIVTRHRGGYCFELNGLFAWLLRSLGYRVEEYFGRWHAGEALAVPLRRHRVLKVFLPEGEFIPDVGIGRVIPTQPFKCELDTLQSLDDGKTYRVVSDATLGKVIQCEADGVFGNYYSFDEAPQQNLDFTYVHYYLAHHPESFFRQRLMVHILTPYGRNSIGTTMDSETGEPVPELNVSLADGTTEKTLLRSSKQLSAALSRYFGIAAEWLC